MASCREGRIVVNAPRTTAISGPVLFARYAYPPNSLGLCGPKDPGGLWQATVEGVDLDHLAHLASQFEGAWPYLKLIAAANNIDDPLDARVVQAYWLGNELIRRVPMATLAASLDDRFSQRTGRKFESLVAAAVAGAVAQHSFHVFAVYPWLGLLRAGKQGPPLEVLDRCRIRWGRIESIDGDTALVMSQPLEFVGSRLVLGAPRVERVHYRFEHSGFVEDLLPGDLVSMHWDWICDHLSAISLNWLQVCTRHNLAAVNALAHPGPAIICGA
jgi:hypothetical protein